MENAGREITDVLTENRTDGRVLIFCGTGNNAGDGMVMARHLALRDIPAQVFLCTDPAKFQGDALIQYTILREMGLPITALFSVASEEIRRIIIPFLEESSWLVDAMLGTGAEGTPRAPMDGVIQWMNSVQNKVLAVDLPSGLDTDTGTATEICVRADITCTLATLKPGLLKDAAKPYVGRLVVCSIGFPVRLAIVEK